MFGCAVRQFVGEQLGQMKHARHIKVKDLPPGVVRELAVGHAPATACVVDQDMQLVRVLVERFNGCVHPSLGREISLKGNDAPLGAFVVDAVSCLFACG